MTSELSIPDDDSATTASTASSFVPKEEFDVCILCPLKKLKNAVESKLSEQLYNVADVMPSGRENIKNLMTTAKHSRCRVLLLTKKNLDTFQRLLAPITKPDYLPIDSTLLVCCQNVSTRQISNYLQGYQAFKLESSDISEITKLICFFIESITETEHQMVTDPKEKMKLFAFLITCVCLQPNSGFSANLEMLNSIFEKKYGPFINMQCGSLHKFVKENAQSLESLLPTDKWFKLDGPNSEVSLTDNGAKLYNQWKEKLQTSREQRKKFHKLQGGLTTLTATDRTTYGTENTNEICELERQSEFLPIGNTTDNWVKTVNESFEVDMDEDEKSFNDQINLAETNYALFLISSNFPMCENRRGVANIPWHHVFDFDPSSRSNGLLASVENIIREQRNLTVSNISDECHFTTNGSTHWVFMKGMKEKSETLFNENSFNWQRTYFTNIEESCESMYNFCSFEKKAIFLVAWYDDDETTTECLQYFLTIIDRIFSKTYNKLQTKIVLCTESQPQSNSILSQIARNLQLEKINFVTPPTLDHWLTHLKPFPAESLKSVHLPCRGEDGVITDFSIPDEKVAWIKDVLEIVPLKSKIKRKKGASSEVGRSFVKGGMIEWDETSMKHIAVERVIQRKVCQDIQVQAIEQCKSKVIRIFHAPGAGGTTFGRQILWALKNKAPCFFVIPTLIPRISEILERIVWIHEQTHLPVVILIDGGMDFYIDRLNKSRTFSVVILSCQRYNQKIDCSRYEPGRCCYLAGKVEKQEAEKLEKLFSRFAPDSSYALQNLCKDVCSNNGHREMFEFGIAAFDHEFKATKSYVRGYMGEKTDKLQYWQQIAAYLALLMYYGQSNQPGMPAQVFHNVVKQHSPFIDFSIECLRSAKQFVIESNGYWKINYHAVAKEILEFVLAIRGDKSKCKPHELSKQAKSKLHMLVIDFVRYVKSTIGNDEPQKILQPLNRMVTTRDYKNVGEIEGEERRNMLSRLLEDINCKENQIDILIECTRAFPNHTEFHAHLGRLYSMYKRFKEAEISLTTALRLHANLRKEANPDRSDNARGRFHHMFGYAYLRKCEYELHKGFDEDALITAQKAVEHFTQGRRYAVYGRLYGYIGEIKVRLLIVESCQKKNNMDQTLPRGEDEKQDLRDFVQVSFSICDQLLVECHQSTTSEDLSKIPDYRLCVEKFNILFKPIELLDRLDKSSVYFCRNEIALIKLHNGGKKYIKYLDEITDQQVLHKIVALLDKSTAKALANEDQVPINGDMQEWLDAIRLVAPEEVSLIDVLQRVEIWESRTRHGFATFYLFVINFLLSLFSAGENLRQQYHRKAVDLDKKLRSVDHRYVIKGKEVLADHEPLTFRKLINKRETGQWNREQNSWSNKEAVQKFKVCTGTIVESRRPLIGFILIDQETPTPACPIQVYFTPKKYQLDGKRFSDQCTRVEFYITFNTNSGTEAMCVKPLERRYCSKCKTKSEVITLNQYGSGTCSNCLNQERNISPL